MNYILDKFFSYIFIFVAAALFTAIFQPEYGEDSGWTFILAIVSLIAYYVLFEGVWQKTVGKFITRTKVVTQNGSKPGFAHILGRTLARFIPFEAISFLFTPIGWHDSVSKTLVVPDHYSEADVQKIDLKNPSLKSGRNTALIIVVICVVGIAVFGLLSTLAVVALNSARQRSRDAKRISDIRQIQTALELGYSDLNNYPTDRGTVMGSSTANVLCDLNGRPHFVPNAASCGTIFMGLVPANPTPGGKPYVYNATITGYQLTFTLEGATGQLNAGINCANGNGITSGSWSC